MWEDEIRVMDDQKGGAEKWAVSLELVGHSFYE